MYVKEIQIAGIITVFSGIILVIGSFIVDPLKFTLLSAKYSDQSEITPLGADFISAFSVIIGSLIITLGFLIIAISNNYEQSQFNYLLISVISWFIIDSIASMMFGYEWNLFLNMAIIIVVSILLVRVRSKYHE